MKRVLSRAAIAVLILAAFGSPLTIAGPTHERDYAYYDGCGSLPSYNGSVVFGCDGMHWYDGVQDGHWMVYRETSCSTGAYVQYAYEKCGGVWNLVSMNDFLSGNCSC